MSTEEQGFENDLLKSWVDAITAAVPNLGVMLGSEVAIEDEVSHAGEDILSSYINLFGETHAYQIGLVGTTANFELLTRQLVGASPDESLTETDIYDSAGEIVNILVGNVKTTVAKEHLTIGLPITVTGVIAYPQPDAQAAVGMRVHDFHFQIVVNIHALPAEVKRQRLLERRIREREVRLQSVLDTAADAIITVGDDGIIEIANRAAGRIFNSSESGLRGTPIKTILPDIGEKMLTDAASSENMFETTGLRDVEERFPLEISISRISLPEESIMVVVGRDIGVRKAMEEELNNARRLDAIGQLAAGIAHEINTPIQYVGDNTHFLNDAFTDLLHLVRKYSACKQSLADAPDKKALLNEISSLEEELDLEFLQEDIPKAISQTLEGISRVASIVGAMKAFSHQGKEKAPININDALNTTIIVCRNEWKYVADVTTDFDTSLPLVPCVAGEVNQVFLNIIVNGAHAIGEKKAKTEGEKGTISVATRQCGESAEIRISDTGMGIPEAVQSHIFEPFFTTKEVGRGTGQGLAISHSIVTKKHGGTLWFETEAGVGTTFVIRLPIRNKEHQTP